MKFPPRVIVLRTAGTNCDQETAFAFESFGADVDLVHIKVLLQKKSCLRDYHILALPGGFTYGDDIESGRILANELRFYLREEISQFIEDGNLVIGICNGFQVLVKSGILPGKSGLKEQLYDSLSQNVTLTVNDSGKFEDRWTYLKVNSSTVWTQGIGDIIYLPVAHAEGKFITSDRSVLVSLEDSGQVVLQYCSSTGAVAQYPANPNGSVADIAGITDSSGRILGLMPHPERHFFYTQHPCWTRLLKQERYGEGAKIFKNGIDYVKSKLL